MFIARADFVQAGLIPVKDQLFYGLDIAVQEHATDQCLDRIGKDGFTTETTTFQLTWPQTQAFTQLKLACDFSEGIAAHQRGAHAAHITFVHTRKTMIKRICNHKT